MQQTVYRPLTVHDFRELPEGPPHYQLIQGEIVMSPALTRRHQAVAGNIFGFIWNFVQTQQIGRVYFAPSDVALTDVNVYQPDIYYVSNANRGILSEQGTEGAPDLVVEIASPKTAKMDRGIKREIYARTGVQELWLVDPDLNRFQVYHLRKDAENPVATYGADDAFESPLFPGLKLHMAQVFQE